MEGKDVIMKLTIKEGNVLGMGGGWPNVYLPKEAKNYLMSKGWTEIELPDLGPCFYMRFTGNDNWEIYIDQQYGGIYVVQEGYDFSPTDDIGTIDDTAYKRDIDDLITLGNCLSNGEDFNTCMNNWYGVKESVKHSKKKYVKEDLYHDAQKAVYDFFMKKQWDLNNPEVANYADAVAEQLELDPEFANGTYTMRDWYKDTYWSYPEEIEWLDSTAY